MEEKQKLEEAERLKKEKAVKSFTSFFIKKAEGEVKKVGNLKLIFSHLGFTLYVL